MKSITIVYADGNPAYEKHMSDCEVITGKTNTQKIERECFEFSVIGLPHHV